MKALDRELVRLQCYEGLDESKALYEWNYQKQLLSIQAGMVCRTGPESDLTEGLFSSSCWRTPEPACRTGRRRTTC